MLSRSVLSRLACFSPLPEFGFVIQIVNASRPGIYGRFAYNALRFRDAFHAVNMVFAGLQILSLGEPQGDGCQLLSHQTGFLGIDNHFGDSPS